MKKLRRLWKWYMDLEVDDHLLLQFTLLTAGFLLQYQVHRAAGIPFFLVMGVAGYFKLMNKHWDDFRDLFR